ncbi:hypothetical protein E2C01_029040 [Portunus trituberculatus]|uniref:Uncharacterized protein n=1 Tax=Portunus trituberculatus TaxID=210409 RepID=A0A5B7ETL8_PORTR|nr:hypothetical protein [Portunus trituberculatus]
MMIIAETQAASDRRGGRGRGVNGSPADGRRGRRVAGGWSRAAGKAVLGQRQQIKSCERALQESPRGRGGKCLLYLRRESLPEVATTPAPPRCNVILCQGPPFPAAATRAPRTVNKTPASRESIINT